MGRMYKLHTSYSSLSARSTVNLPAAEHHQYGIKLYCLVWYRYSRV